jgi:hypothetical protein
MIVIPKYTVSKYDPDSAIPNERTDFTRRIPTGLSDKQMARDSKIIMQIIRADGDPSKVLEIFLGKARLLSNPRYWEVMRTVWVSAGSTETAPVFRKLMKSARPCRGWFMTPEDAEALDKMQFPLTVWRAYDLCYDGVESGDPGISWTLDRDWCMGYARSKGLLKILVGDYLSAVSNGLFIIVLVQTAMIHKRAMFWRATVIKQYELISVMIEKYQELRNSVQEKGAAKED